MSGRIAYLACLTTLVACSSQPTAPPPADDTISLTGFIRTFIDVPDLLVGAFDLEGVAPVQPDAEGAFTLHGLPRGERFTLEATGSGIVATLTPVPASAEDVYGFRVLAPREGTATYPSGIDPQAADVMVLTQRHGYLGTGLALATLSMSPPAAQPVDYRNDAGVTDLSGRAFFREASPGILTVTVDSDRPCAALAGWEGPDASSALVPAAAGHFTLVPIVCPDPEGSRITQGEVARMSDGEVVADATVCVGPSECATSNAAGVFQLSIADGEQRTLTMTADGYLDSLRALGDSYKASGNIGVEAWTPEEMEALSVAAGVAPSTAASYLMFAANASGWEATVSPTPATGPIYFATDGNLDATLTTASIAGRAFATGVTFPSVSIDLTHPGLACGTSSAWLGDLPFEVPTAAASVTVVYVGCYPP